MAGILLARAVALPRKNSDRQDIDSTELLKRHRDVNRSRPMAEVFGSFEEQIRAVESETAPEGGLD